MRSRVEIPSVVSPRAPIRAKAQVTLAGVVQDEGTSHAPSPRCRGATFLVDSGISR